MSKTLKGAIVIDGICQPEPVVCIENLCDNNGGCGPNADCIDECTQKSCKCKGKDSITRMSLDIFRTLVCQSF